MLNAQRCPAEIILSGKREIEGFQNVKLPNIALTLLIFKIWCSLSEKIDPIGTSFLQKWVAHVEVKQLQLSNIHSFVLCKAPNPPNLSISCTITNFCISTKLSVS